MPKSASSLESGASNPGFRIFGAQSKVKTGCITCKKRRMKCDEIKPSCTKCTSTGRTCGGYQPPLKNRRQGAVHGASKPKTPTPTQVQVLSQLSLLPNCTTNQRHWVDFFINSTMRIMVPWRTPDFWYPITRLIDSNPSVRYAIIALSATHEHLSYVHSTVVSDMTLEQRVVQNQKLFALEKYNRSLTLLMEDIENRRSTAAEIALINCVIFVVLNFMWGDIRTALIHLKSGGEILDGWKNRQVESEGVTHGGLEEDLPSVFAALGLESAGTKARSGRDRTPFDSLDIAAETIRTLAEEIKTGTARYQHKLIGSGEEHNHNSFQEIEKDYHQRLKQWAFKFEGLVDLERPNLTDKEGWKINNLRLQHLSIFSRLSEHLPQETADRVEVPGSLVEWSKVLLKGYWEDQKSPDSDTLELCDSRVWPAHSVHDEHNSLAEKALMLLTKITATS